MIQDLKQHLDLNCYPSHYLHLKYLTEFITEFLITCTKSPSYLYPCRLDHTVLSPLQKQV